MGFLQLMKLATAHVQYMGLLSKLDIPWPDSFMALLNFSDLINFDFSFIFDLFNVPEIDQRMMFIAVAIGIPLFLMILTAVVFFSLSSILQIEIAITGVLIVAGHIFAIVLPEWIPQDMHEPLKDSTFFVTGAAFLVSPIIYKTAKLLPERFDFLEYASRLVLPITSIVGGFVLTASSQLVRDISIGVVAVYGCYYIANRPLARGKRSLICILLLGAAASLIVLVKWNVIMAPQYNVLGVVNIVLGVLHCIQQLLLTNSTSRVAKVLLTVRGKIQHALDTGLLALALFGLGAVFVPVLTYCLDTFLCAPYTCPTGSKFNPRTSRPEKSFSTDPELFCDKCTFNSTECLFSTDALCPAFSSQRLLKFPLVPCDDSGYKFFVAAAAIVLFVFLFVVTFLYIRVIRLCTTVLHGQMLEKMSEANELRLLVEKEKEQHEAALLTLPQKKKELDPFASDEELEELLLSEPSPSAIVPKKETQAELKLACFPEPQDGDGWWKYAMERSEPKASSLYQPFRYTFRFFLLVEIVHKVAVVMSTVIWAPYSNWATVGNLSSHLLMTIALLVCSPMIEQLEQRLSVILGVCSSLNAVYAICVWQAPEAFSDEGWGIALIVVNVAVPIVAGTILYFVQVRQTLGGNKSKAEKRREQEERAKEKAEEAKREADLALRALAGNPLTEEEQRQEQKRKEDKSQKAKDLTPEQKTKEGLNGQTKSTILVVFAYVSVPILCVALGLTIFATLTSHSKEFINGSNPFDRGASVVLNGYNNWQTFTTSCCCFSPPKQFNGFNTTERWVCTATPFENATQVTSVTAITVGRTVDRGRVMMALTDNGLPIRGLCSKEIVRNCSLSIKGGESTDLSCEMEFLAQKNVTNIAVRTLW